MVNFTMNSKLKSTILNATNEFRHDYNYNVQKKEKSAYLNN